MKELRKLIDVKSIVTLTFTALVFILALKKIITGEQVMMTYTTIIAFYFGTQSVKKKGGSEGDREELTKSNDT